MPRKERRETPVVFTDWSTIHAAGGPTVHEHQRPFSPLQALMECRPGGEAQESAVGLQPLREAVVDCLDALSAFGRLLLEGTHIERVTVRELAARVGLHKTHTYRLVRQAEVHLRDQCLQHPVILSYLGVTAAIVPIPLQGDVAAVL